jgi:hypothetical protein
MLQPVFELLHLLRGNRIELLGLEVWHQVNSDHRLLGRDATGLLAVRFGVTKPPSAFEEWRLP